MRESRLQMGDESVIHKENCIVPVATARVQVYCLRVWRSHIEKQSVKLELQKWTKTG